MDRRKALYNLSTITCLAFVGNSLLLTGCDKQKAPKEALDDNDIQLLNEIGEVIISSTIDSPGAKAANTGKYIQVMVHDCMSSADKLTFMEGWQHVQELGRQKYKEEILNLSDSQKTTYLSDLDKYTTIGDDKIKSDLAIAAFQKIKQLTIRGYFTSEVGATKALRYDLIPGNFKGEIDYNYGDKVWALNM